jgi:hypothetical protein
VAAIAARRSTPSGPLFSDRPRERADSLGQFAMVHEVLRMAERRRVYDTMQPNDKTNTSA